MSNTQGQLVKYNHDIEDKVLAVLPPAIREYVLYDSPVDWCVVELFKALRSGMTPREILDGLRADQRIKTRDTYGIRHPQSRIV